MKIAVERKTLTDAARLAAQIAGKEGMTTGVHIDATGDRPVVSARNFDETVATALPVDVISPGVAFVPAALFARFLGTCTDDQVELTLDDGALSVASGHATAALLLMDPDTWIPPKPVDGDSFTLDATHTDRIARILYAASTDQNRGAAMQGVHLEGRWATCTDSFRMARADLGDDVDLPAVTIPAAPLAKVLKAAPVIDVIVADDVAIESRDGVRWTLRRIVDDYPRVDGLIRDESPHALTCATQALADAVDRAEVFADSEHRLIEIELDGLMAKVASGLLDVGELLDEVPSSGDLAEPIVFNGRYLSDLLKSHAGDEITIEAVDRLKPVVVHGDGLTHLLMPVKNDRGRAR